MKLEIGLVVEGAGDRFKVVELPTETNGGRLRFEVDMVATPADMIMPLHSHPDMTETTEMLEGVMEIYTGGKHLTVGPDESYSSAPGVLHKGRNPGPGRSRFYWSLDPEPHISSIFERTVCEYWEGCAVCGMLGHFAIMRIEQYLHEGLTGKDSVTGEPIKAEEALKEAGIMIDRAGGLRAVSDSAEVFKAAKPFVAGVAQDPVRAKLFELFAALSEQAKGLAK